LLCRKPAASLSSKSLEEKSSRPKKRLASDEVQAGGLPQNNIDDIFSLEGTRLGEECFLALVMHIRPVQFVNS